MPERRDDVLASLFRDTRNNAVIGWIVVALTLTVFVESLLDLDLLWIAFSAAVLVVMIVPPIARNDFRVMLPWELLLLAALPVAIRGLVPGAEIGTFATYFSLAAFALLVVVELDMFTKMYVTHWFAVVLVTLTTLSSAAAWTILRWNMDLYLGTSYLVDNETLMIEFIYVTLAGLAAGVLFDRYFTRRNRKLRRHLEREVN